MMNLRTPGIGDLAAGAFASPLAKLGTSVGDALTLGAKLQEARQLAQAREMQIEEAVKLQDVNDKVSQMPAKDLMGYLDNLAREQAAAGLHSAAIMTLKTKEEFIKSAVERRTSYYKSQIEAAKNSPRALGQVVDEVNGDEWLRESSGALRYEFNPITQSFEANGPENAQIQLSHLQRKEEFKKSLSPLFGVTAPSAEGPALTEPASTTESGPPKPTLGQLITEDAAAAAEAKKQDDYRARVLAYDTIKKDSAQKALSSRQPVEYTYLDPVTGETKTTTMGVKEADDLLYGAERVRTGEQLKLLGAKEASEGRIIDLKSDKDRQQFQMQVSAKLFDDFKDKGFVALTPTPEEMSNPFFQARINPTDGPYKDKILLREFDPDKKKEIEGNLLFVSALREMDSIFEEARKSGKPVNVSAVSNIPVIGKGLAEVFTSSPTQEAYATNMQAFLKRTYDIGGRQLAVQEMLKSGITMPTFDELSKRSWSAKRGAFEKMVLRNAQEIMNSEYTTKGAYSKPVVDRVRKYYPQAYDPRGKIVKLNR